ncbi:MAG: UvrB/UvrC motif-containing protein [Phycisphaerae bacterium]
MLCQRCKKQTATVHLTDLVQGEKRERHLCEDCANAEGVVVKQNVSINDVLNSFLMSQASIQEMARLRCPECGITFVEFRNQGLLGCPNDYDVFGKALTGIIERAQDGQTRHTGKTPGQVVRIDPVQQERFRLQRELREAVEREDYEQAAKIRDRLGELQSQ